MAKNLIRLIQASGSAGVSGQTFRGNVLPTQAVTNMTGYKMTDYLISSWYWAGQPAVPGETSPYASGTTFNFTAYMSRGAQAWRIQRLTSSAFTVALNNYTGGVTSDGSYATVASLSDYNQGEQLYLGVTVYGKSSNNWYVTTNSSPQGSQPGAYGIPWQIDFSAAPTSSGGSGTTDYRINISYVPDVGYFNNPLDNLSSGYGWPLRITDRIPDNSQMEYRWYPTYTDGVNDTGLLSTYAYCSAYSYGSPGVSVWMKYRWPTTYGGSGQWSTLTQVSFSGDTRNEQ